MLVAPWVAAGMTDLLQSAVLSAAPAAPRKIGRPVAGKTGTTTSNKDGWFIGFSSGLTTGVWMGRDDAKAVAGLQGGTAPARAFADFMRVAVANRPVEQFETEVPLPDWQLEPDEEVWGLPYEDGGEPAGRRKWQSDRSRRPGDPLGRRPPASPASRAAPTRPSSTGSSTARCRHASSAAPPPRAAAAVRAPARPA